jgi:peptidoglycan/LPS O-acetylase OafA/YrhL
MLIVTRSGSAARLLSLPWICFLGKISFGLYVFHLLTNHCSALLFGKIGFIPTSDLINYLLRMSVALAMCIALATASYFLFERPFLRLKLQISVIRSRPI